MKKPVFFLCFALVFASCKDSKQPQQNEVNGDTKIYEDFSALLKSYYEEKNKIYPLEATIIGDTRHNDYLPNFLTGEFIQKERKFYSDPKNSFMQFKNNELNENEHFSKQVLLWEYDINLQEPLFKIETPIDQMRSTNLYIDQWASGSGVQPFKTPQDYKNWLKRHNGNLSWMASAKQRMREGTVSGNVLSKPLIISELPQLKS